MEQKLSYFSLSGFSGVLTGIYGLLVTYIVDFLTNGYSDGFSTTSILPIAFIEIFIITTAILVTIITLITLWIRAKRKAKKNNHKLWNSTSKKIRLNTLISLLIIAILLIVIAIMGYYSLVVPITLFLYGLFLLNLNRLSPGKLKYLAFAEIILALAAYFIYDKEMLFLTLGFGVFHIVYGLISFLKNKKAIAN